MPVITTLTADRALTKTITLNGSEPYPMVKNFASADVRIESITEFAQVIEIVAQNQGCLLKGNLSRAIDNEPRAGLTNQNAPTQWIVFDYDGDSGFDKIDDLLYEIDPALVQTDHVFQHSASSGLRNNTGVRGHAFFMLEAAAAPQTIKQWIKRINLTNPTLKSKLALSKNGMTLIYPLDITVNQNDKLIYVAPPILRGIEDPISKRVELRTRKYRTFNFDVDISTEAISQLETAVINDLRDASGFEKRKAKFTMKGQDEILLNPSQCVVTGVMKSGEFTRVNLNGGDSWAYWYRNDEPELLHNFKGEPSVYIEHIAPDYYKQIKLEQELSCNKPFVFRELLTDTYYNAEYNENTGYLEFCAPVSSKAKLIEFMAQRGQIPPRVIPDWNLRFDPTDPQTVDFTNKIANTYVPTLYSKLRADTTVTSSSFPTIDRVIKHICVDEPTYQHFMRWVAHIMQYKTKTQTAWLFSGISGTGKGVMYSHILKPLIGRQHCAVVTNDQMEEKYNDFLRDNMLCFVDEADAASSKLASKIMAKLKTWITEPFVPIRAMRVSFVEQPSFSNFILATNVQVPIKLEAGDRRWNIAPKQYAAIKLSQEEIFDVIPGELEAFTKYLMALPVSRDASIQILKNQARDDILELSRTVADDFFIALASGDLEFFTERLMDKPPMADIEYLDYANIVSNWMASAGKPTAVDVTDLCKVYVYVCGKDKRQVSTKHFGHLASRHNFRSVQKRINGIKRNAYTVEFSSDEGYSEWLTAHAPMKIPSNTLVQPESSTVN